MLDATSVTLMGVEVLSAMYCSALYSPTPSSPSNAKRLRCGHSPLPGRSTQAASGSSNAPANTQRRKLKVMGGMAPCIKRPTTALPAHMSGGISSRAMVDGVRRGAGADMRHCTHPVMPRAGTGLTACREGDTVISWQHGGWFKKQETCT